MTHSIQLVIIGVIVSIAAYIILRLLRDNDRLMLELDEAKAEARTLDADLDEARRSNGIDNAHIKQLYAQLDVMDIRLSKYKKQAKGYEISLNALDAEHRKTIQQLYGRIGAMQKQLNRLRNQE